MRISFRPTGRAEVNAFRNQSARERIPPKEDGPSIIFNQHFRLKRLDINKRQIPDHTIENVNPKTEEIPMRNDPTIECCLSQKKRVPR